MQTECVCGKSVYTFVAHIGVCKECHESYCEEGRKYLPMSDRKVYRSIIDRARDQKNPQAVGYIFDGY